MKSKRHAKILEIISKYSIETQEELSERLEQEGFPVAQATVSRDIRELKLTKAQDGSGRQKYISLNENQPDMSEKYIRIFHGYGAEYSGDSNRFRYGNGSCSSFGFYGLS